MLSALLVMIVWLTLETCSKTSASSTAYWRILGEVTGLCAQAPAGLVTVPKLTPWKTNMELDMNLLKPDDSNIHQRTGDIIGSCNGSSPVRRQTIILHKPMRTLRQLAPLQLESKQIFSLRKCLWTSFVQNVDLFIEASPVRTSNMVEKTMKSENSTCVFIILQKYTMGCKLLIHALDTCFCHQSSHIYNTNSENPPSIEV